jgi:hypothetical protein
LYNSKRAANGRDKLQTKLMVKVSMMVKGGNMANGTVHRNRWWRRSAITFGSKEDIER